jgi:hypothetical protein
VDERDFTISKPTNHDDELVLGKRFELELVGFGGRRKLRAADVAEVERWSGGA